MTGGNGELHGFTEDVRQGWRGFRGAGDAIRGSLTEALDGVISKEGVAKDQAIKEKGFKDMRQTDERLNNRYGAEGDVHKSSTTHHTPSHYTPAASGGRDSPDRHYERNTETPMSSGASEYAPPPAPPVRSSGHEHEHKSGAGSHFSKYTTDHPSGTTTSHAPPTLPPR